MTGSFSHLDAGTPEAVWLPELARRALPELALDIDRLVVFAAHPDDETLGAAGLIRRAHEAGRQVVVVVLTDGEASHPGSPTHTRSDLAAIRRDEVGRALLTLAPRADLQFLGLPDGGLRERTVELDIAIGLALDGPPIEPARTLVVAPFSGDRHRDHRVAAQAVARACAERGIRHYGYPIWLWHWGTPEDVPWDAAVRLRLTPGERSIKERALRAHRSQTDPLSSDAGDEPVVSTSMAAHFARDSEVFFEESVTGDAGGTAGSRSHAVRVAEPETLAPGFFDAFYARHADPWGFETRWYEERKRAILLASLPAARLGRVLEIGCSTGHVTEGLAARADRVTALDVSRAALETARRRIGDEGSVEFVQGGVPHDFPDGAFDTIVLSEVGYYLSPRDLRSTIERAAAALTPTGCLVACHWRHPVPEYPLTGDDVHGALRASTAWEALARHEEEDFVLEVFCSRPAQSVARREGLR
jgi:LmbE family N-acetylglucosaminyl deacetylase/SAM-dependent methyltransferase